MRWIFVLLLGLLAHTATAQQLLTSYVRVQWSATNLTAIEANENRLRSAVVSFLAPNITANVTFLEIRAANTNISVSQAFTIELAVQANASAATASTFLTALLSTTSTTSNLTRSIITTIPGASVVCDVGGSPSSTRLRIAPTPPTLNDLAANASYVFTNLRYLGAPNFNATNFAGTTFSLVQLTRMRYAFYSLLGFKNDEEATVVQVSNTTVGTRRETHVLVFFRFNAASRLANTTIATLANGTTTGNVTTTLADAMAAYNFTARNFNLTVSVPWTPTSVTWWIVDATNATFAPSPTNTTRAPATISTPPPTTTGIVFPTTRPVPTTPQPTAPLPTTIVPELDGGLVPFPFIHAFNVTTADLAPVYTQPGACGGHNQFCLHLKWVVQDPDDAYVLARLKGDQFINSSVLASSYGPAFNASTASVWTLYDMPRSPVILDLVRSSDLALVSVAISANLLSPNSATSTVTSTSNRNIFVRYAATPISAKELVLEIRVIVGTPPAIATQTLQDEGCAYCSKLAAQCAKDPACTAIKLCVDNATSVWDQTNLILNGDYGDSLNTTLATATCFDRPNEFDFSFSPAGRDLFDKYMACMLTRSCPFVVDGPSKLVWQAPTPGWIQIQLLPWSLPYYSTLEFNLSYANYPPCPIYLSNDNTTANLTQQLAACVQSDCEVVVLVNTTNVTTVDIVFNNHIGPMPELTWTPTETTPYIDTAFAIIPKLASSSALALLPVNDPVTNPATPQNECSSCWLEFLETCLLDEGCNAYINCIMKGSFESIATLIQFGRTGATFNLSPAILACSDPTAPTWASWRFLQKASRCYAKAQCPVASQGPKNVVWQVPNRTQSITYTLPVDPTDSPPAQFMFRNQLDYNWNVMYGGVAEFGSILPTILDMPDVVVSDPTNSTSPVDGSFTYTWLVTYPSYAGFLPTYYIGDFGGNVLSIVNDAPPSALLVVQNQTWNATAWNVPLF